MKKTTKNDEDLKEEEKIPYHSLPVYRTMERDKSGSVYRVPVDIENKNGIVEKKKGGVFNF